MALLRQGRLVAFLGVYQSGCLPQAFEHVLASFLEAGLDISLGQVGLGAELLFEQVELRLDLALLLMLDEVLVGRPRRGQGVFLQLL